MVPGEGIEPPTFGLQNRCTTAVLTRPGPRFPRSLRQGQEAAVSAGVRACMASACTRSASKSLSAAFTMRWRSTRDRPSNAAEVIFTVKWLRSEEHTSELQSLMRISYAVFCLKKKKQIKNKTYKRI